MNKQPSYSFDRLRGSYRSMPDPTPLPVLRLPRRSLMPAFARWLMGMLGGRTRGAADRSHPTASR